MSTINDSDTGNTVTGTSGDDVINGNGGDDGLSGLDGNDILDGGAGNDALDGGNGIDTASYASAASAVAVTLAITSVQNTIGAGNDTLIGIENLIGSSFDDFLAGNAGDNNISGGAGDDTIEGGGGNNFLDGGSNNADLLGDAVYYGDAPGGVTVNLSLATAQNTIGATFDTLTGFESVIGSAFNDVLTGNASNNELSGGRGNDILDGGGGVFDAALYDDATSGVTVNLTLTTAQNVGGGLGADTLINIESLLGSNFNDVLTGNDNANFLVGGAGSDMLVGNGGDDFLEGDGGANTLNGGAGNDTVVYSQAASALTVDLDPTSSIVFHDGSSDNLVSVESFIGSSFDDRFFLDNLDHRIDGGAGNDTVDFRDGAAGVTVSLQIESAQQTGGSGVETLISIEGLVGTAFNDTLTGNDSDNTLDGGLGDDLLNGGAGSDTASYSLSTQAVVVDLSVSTAQNTHAAGSDTLISIENLIGGSGDDVLSGSGGDNHLQGMDGNDILKGGAGNDILDGGSGTDMASFADAPGPISINVATVGSVVNFGLGSDTLISIEGFVGGNFNDVLTGDANTNFLEGGGGNDVIDGGGGIDTALYTTALSGVTVSLSMAGPQNTIGAGIDTLTNIENLTGSAFNDILQGDDGNNVISGGAGDDLVMVTPGDIILGGDGVDTISFANIGAAVSVFLPFPGLGDLTATGGAGNISTRDVENVIGTAFNDTIAGYGIRDGSNISAYDNSFWGGAGDDVLNGGNGTNVLDGGAGNDTLFGGQGTDTASYGDATAGVTVSLAISGFQNTVGAGSDSLSQIENLTGSAFNDTLTGDANVNVIRGGAGNDVIDGGGNVDTAVFSGLASAYTITHSGDVATVVGPDGTDTLTNVEYFQFADQTIHFLPGVGTAVNFSADPSTFMGAIRDFDGNDLGDASGWQKIGTVDIQGDGTPEQIFVNSENGRWASVGTGSDGLVYFDDHGWAGDTRVVGIYIDPLVQSGEVVQGSDFDSQRRFQNDLFINNIHGILGAGDYDHNGLQEVYFSLTDGTAYLHAYMHADGNIEYANYQSEAQVISYLTSEGYNASTWANWFPDGGHQTSDLVSL